MRTHTCGQLRKDDAEKEVTLCGFVDATRNYGKIAFIDIRDRYGMTQLFLNKTLAAEFGELRRESVIKVVGKVNARPDNQVNKDMLTGEVEVEVLSLTVLNEVPVMPLELDESVETTEETRLKNRYLDLRKPRLQKNLVLRHKVFLAIRDFLDKEGFLEIETPILAKSTPEGARDYIVPSRVHPGKVYALPQSPQMFKQLLMVSGYDKYFQIVRCFRDEDLRADRQPEFTQLDIEMSFVTEEDIFSVMERMFQHLFKKVLQVDIPIPFERITHAEAMSKYKTDKPDLRKEGERFKFCWVTDFPLFETNAEGQITPSHHPFTSPHLDDLALLRTDPLKVRSRAYDTVLNGFELSSGSIRIHDRELQKLAFKSLNIGEEEAQEKFGFLLDALKFAPPHGGIAFGLDRIVMIMAGEENIREVIAFPKTQDAKDLMLDAPSVAGQQQLDDVHIRLKDGES